MGMGMGLTITKRRSYSFNSEDSTGEAHTNKKEEHHIGASEK